MIDLARNIVIQVINNRLFNYEDTKFSVFLRVLRGKSGVTLHLHRKLLRTFFKSAASGSSARRPERRNRSVLDVHEDFEHRATRQSGRVAAFKARS